MEYPAVSPAEACSPVALSVVNGFPHPRLGEAAALQALGEARGGVGGDDTRVIGTSGAEGNRDRALPGKSGGLDRSWSSNPIDLGAIGFLEAINFLSELDDNGTEEGGIFLMARPASDPGAVERR